MVKLVENPDEHEAPERVDNVIHLRMVTQLDVDADTVLKDAIGKLDGVIIIGYIKGDPQNRNANDEYFSSSIAAGDTVVWLLERCKYKLMRFGDDPWVEECEDDDTA